jgi:hypothetical protein
VVALCVYVPSCCSDSLPWQLGFSTTPKYLQRSGQAVHSIVFNSTAIFNAGAKYVTFKALSTLPSGSYFDARVAQVVNYATGALRTSALLSNSTAGSAVVTPAPDGNYGFLCVSALAPG